MYFAPPSMVGKESPYYDKIYYIGNVAHEFPHIPFDKYRHQIGGYGGEPQAKGAPQWFTEGLGEYFRILVIGEEIFEEKYKQRYDQGLSNLRRYGLNRVKDVYAAGAWSFRFIDDQFSLPTVINILKSPEQIFWKAVRAEIGLQRNGFEQRFRNWLPRG